MNRNNTDKTIDAICDVIGCAVCGIAFYVFLVCIQ